MITKWLRQVTRTIDYCRTKEPRHAEVCHRTRDPWGGEVVAGPASGDLANLVRRASPDGPEVQWVESSVTDDKVYCTSRLMKKRCASMRRAAVFRPIAYRKFARRSTRPPLNNDSRVVQWKITALGRVAQLVRAPASHAGGRRFESCRAHHFLRFHGE